VERDGSRRVAGIAADTGNGPVAFACAPIVIGADGLSSTIGRAVEAPVEYETSAPPSAFVYGYFEELAADQYHWYYRPGVSAGVIPTNGGLTNVFAGLPAAAFAAQRNRGIDAVFRSTLAVAAPDVADAIGDASPVLRFRSWPGRAGFLRRAHGPGWALVGDAGYYKDPMTAHGITDALRDAELLARAVLDTPVGAPDAAAYQPVRDRLARPFLDATAAAASYDWDLAELQAIHLDLKRATDPEHALIASLGTPLVAAA
jgi:flavin-dependent dehydrogenase